MHERTSETAQAEPEGAPAARGRAAGLPASLLAMQRGAGNAALQRGDPRPGARGWARRRLRHRRRAADRDRRHRRSSRPTRRPSTSARSSSSRWPATTSSRRSSAASSSAAASPAARLAPVRRGRQLEAHQARDAGLEGPQPQLARGVRDRPPQGARRPGRARPRGVPRLDGHRERRRHADEGRQGLPVALPGRAGPADGLRRRVAVGLRPRPGRAQEGAGRSEGQARRGRDVHQVPARPEGAVAAKSGRPPTRGCRTGRSSRGRPRSRTSSSPPASADACATSRRSAPRTASKIPIYLPKTFDSEQRAVPPDRRRGGRHHLAGPEQVRRMVKEVHVNPGRNPSDTYWATQPGYSKTGLPLLHDRGRGGHRRASTRARTPHRADSARKSLAHESGHIVSQKLWGTNPNGTKWKPWRDAMKSDGLVRPRATRSPRRRRTSPSPGRCSWR